MSVEQVGPGGVSNSYGVRVTNVKQEYDNEKAYKEVFIPEGTVPLTATVSSSGEIRFSAGNMSFRLPTIYAPPGFSPTIIASLVAGATASQSDSTVTVTAAGHGIVGNSSKDGYRIYYPGSASIPAGWYAGFAWVNANTITFQRAAATVASEPINGGAEFVSAQDICALSIPGGRLQPGTLVSVVTTRRSDTTSSNKILRVYYGGTQLAASVASSNSVFQSQRIGFVCLSRSAQVGLPNTESTPTGQSQHTGNVDTSVAQPLIVSGQLAGAGSYIAIDAMCVEIA